VAIEAHASPRTAAARGAPAGSLPIVYLELTNGRSESDGRRSRQLGGPLTLIGAVPQCDLWLRDDSISKVHASLVLTPHGAWIVDLLGREGILVDGRSARWMQVHEGTELQIGRFRFRVRFASPAPVPAPGQGVLATRRVRSDLSSPRVVSGELAPRPRSRRRAPRGTISEESVMLLVQQLSDMQQQFFEHSQLQMQLMSQMLLQLGHNQQASVQRDLARIDEIGRELKEIQSQLGESRAQETERAAAGSSNEGASTAAAEVSPDDRPVKSASQKELAHPRLAGVQPAATTSVDSVPARASVPQPEQAQSHADESVEPANSEGPAESSLPEDASEKRRPTAASYESHQRLTRRMAKLANERNTRWRRILQAFKGKPVE
jgi:hypothetical protein